MKETRTPGKPGQQPSGPSLLRSIRGYIRYILSGKMGRKLLSIQTEPLDTPFHFRDIPHLTGRGCTHCFLCMAVCPAPGAIEVVKEGMPAVWNPRIHPGHCIRCALCVEACPEVTLDSGRVWPMTAKKETFLDISNHIQVNPVTCMGCGICTVSCPINRQIDPILAAKGTSTSADVIMKVNKGINTVYHEEKCTGCKTCEESCPTGSIRVARILQACQMIYDDDDDDMYEDES